MKAVPDLRIEAFDECARAARALLRLLSKMTASPRTKV
jgi:hypothetical protein